MKTKNIIITTCGIVIASLIVIAILLLRTPKYEVTFTNDGSVYETIEVKANRTITEPTAPKKEGYKFLGWYLNGEKFDFSTKITKNLELVAKWVKDDAIVYTIKFDSNGGNSLSDIQIEKNSIIGKLPIPSKKGYSFVGWYYGTKLIKNSTIVTKDMLLVAKWEKEEKTTKRTEKIEKTTKKTEKTTTKKPTEETTKKPVEAVKTTTKPVVTTKKPAEAVKTTTKVVATTKKPVVTTKKTTTTKKVDEISYKMEDIKDGEIASAAGQIRLFLIKNNVKVAGTCDIVTIDGKTITKYISADGYETNKGLIETIKNIKIN